MGGVFQYSLSLKLNTSNIDNPWILNTMIQKQCSVPIHYTVDLISVTDTFKLVYIGLCPLLTLGACARVTVVILSVRVGGGDLLPS